MSTLRYCVLCMHMHTIKKLIKLGKQYKISFHDVLHHTCEKFATGFSQ